MVTQAAETSVAKHRMDKKHLSSPEVKVHTACFRLLFRDRINMYVIGHYSSEMASAW